MKKICFIEMEGVLTPIGDYVPDEKKVKSFLTKICSFAKKNKIELFMISGHIESVAKNKHACLKVSKCLGADRFLCVDENYIKEKAEMDEKLHRDALSKNPEFVDTYFKQVMIQKILAEKKIQPKDALLLSDDVWVDGYYTMRFSKIDFAIFEDNVVDRGKKISKMQGLAYFNLDFASVKKLIEAFPSVDTSALDVYVFEEMKKVLVGDAFVKAVKNELMKKQMNN